MSIYQRIALTFCVAAMVGATTQARAAESEEGAAGAIEEIIVTARFREETVQDIGGSLAALGRDAIEGRGILDFEDIARQIVGLNLFDRGPNQNEVSIRGISANAALFWADNSGQGPLVSQYLDDVPVASSLGAQRDLNYFDFDRVEVLRGPQPTLFGEGAVAGTIRYVSRDPDLSGDSINDSVLKTGVSFTEDGGTNFSVAGATSLVMAPDVFGIRGVFNYRDDDGYIDNPVLGEDDVNDYESVSGRIVALLEPNDNLSIRLSAHLSRDEAGATSLVDAPSPTNSPGDLELNAVVGGGHDDDFDMYSGKIEYDFGLVTVTSITGYYERERSVRQINFPSLNVFCPFILGAGSTCSPLGFSESEEESFSQEFRFVSNFDGPLNFTAGAFYQDSELDVGAGANAPEFANPAFTNPVTTETFRSLTNFESEQYSAFLESTIEATERFRLIGGVRYVNEKIESTALIATNLNPFTALAMGLPPLPIPTADGLFATTLFGFSLSEEFEVEDWLPRGAIEFDLTDDAMVYATVAKGVRSGNLNPPNSVALAAGFNPTRFSELRTYEEDSAVSYEAGAKARWMDGSLTTNLSIYHTSYKDPALMIAVPFVLNINGPDIDITGFEFETYWLANEMVSFYAGIGFQDAEFDDSALLIPQVAALGFAADLQEGNAPVNAPEWSLSLGADFRFPLPNNSLALTGNVGYQYVDSSFSTPQNFPSTKLDSQSFLNIRVGVESEKWSLVAYATNLTDEVRYQHIEYTAGPFINADGDLDNVVIAGSANRPRTIGAEITMRL